MISGKQLSVPDNQTPLEVFLIEATFFNGPYSSLHFKMMLLGQNDKSGNNVALISGMIMIFKL